MFWTWVSSDRGTWGKGEMFITRRTNKVKSVRILQWVDVVISYVRVRHSSLQDDATYYSRDHNNIAYEPRGNNT